MSTKEQMELRVKMLLRNGLVSKSSQTLADTEVLKEIAMRLGYDIKTLKTLDITDPEVNCLAKPPVRKRRTKFTAAHGLNQPKPSRS